MQNIASSLYGAEQDLTGGVAVMLLDIAIIIVCIYIVVACFYSSAYEARILRYDSPNGNGGYW